MANFNRVLLLGRLTRDPEGRSFQNGGKVANFGFAVNNRKKNQQSGNWEDVPVFLEISVFNRGENGRSADLVLESCQKGTQLFIEGHLVLDQWTDNDGNSRQKLKVVADSFQFTTPANQNQGQGQQSGGQQRQQRPVNRTNEPRNQGNVRRAPTQQYQPQGDYDNDQGGQNDFQDNQGGGDDQIPF